MIDSQLYFAFVAAVAVLMLIPGPNVALIVANSVAHGVRLGLLTVAGTSSAMVIQLALTGLGMTAALGVMAHWLEWIRWIGVAYLVFLGVQHWRAPAIDLAATPPQPKSARAIYARGLLVSLTNPKTLLFYSAFFPQFITAGDARMGGQVLVLSVTFLCVAVAIDGGWAVLASRARGVLRGRGRLRQRLSGGLLIGAGLGLAFARNR